MRVLYFSDSYGPHDHRFLHAIEEAGYQGYFLRRRAGPARESRPLPRSVQSLPPLERLGSSRRRLGGNLAEALRVLLEDLHIDLVHAGPVQDCAWLVARAGHPGLVAMSWGSDLLVRARFGLGRWIARATLRRSASFIGDCRAVFDSACSLGMDPSRMFIFPWGVDLASFRPSRASAARRQLGWEGTVVLVCVRTWEPGYGVETVVRAFIQAAARRSDLRLILAGDGSLRPWILATLGEAGVADRVWLPGHVRYEDLPMIYQASDIYVSASESDGSSVSLLEAMACGLPALVSLIPGNLEWVAPEVNGWLFRPRAVDQLANGMLRAPGEPPEVLRAYGVRSRQIAERRANWVENKAHILRAYAEALAMTEPSP